MRYVAFAVAFCTVATAASANGTCASGGQLAVGQPVEMAWSESWYPGTLVAVSMLDPRRPYLVRDENGDETWLATEEVRPVALQAAGTASLRAEDTFGDWRLAPRDEAATDDRQLKGLQPEGGTLAIQPDGTFTWNSAEGEVRGLWEATPADASSRGPVRLRGGVGGQDWFARFDGLDPTGQDLLRVVSTDGHVLLGYGRC